MKISEKIGLKISEITSKRKTKKHGFTLIELLAVIAILAVIAVITIPIVSNMLEKSRKNAFVNSVVQGMESTRNELAANDFEDFPSEGIEANDKKTGLEKNPFISGTFKKISSEKGIYAFKVTDGRYCSTGHKLDLETVLGPCYLLDKTPPVVNLVSGIITSRSIQVVANATDEESGIVNYQFSKDNGATWMPAQTSNTYIFDKLTKNTSFTIKVKVTNENSLVTEKAITLKTNNIDMPTYTSSPALTTWSRSKVVTISYPARQTNFIYEYSLNAGSTWTVVSSGTTQSITFNANGNVTARVRDGYNTVTASTLTITTIDTSSPGVPTSVTRYDSSGGSVRGNTTSWTNRTLWWGEFRASDSGGSGIARYEYSTGCTGSSSGTLSSSHTYSSNTSYKFCIRAVDNAGNIGSWSGAYYFNVDKSGPSCSTSGGSSTWTNGNRTLYGTCSDTGGSGCTGSVSRGFTSNANGNYSPGTVSDNAGNSTSCPTNTVKIDKTAPSCSTSGGSTSWTSGNRTLTGTCSDSGGSGCTGSVSRGFTSTTNGSYSPGTVRDVAGNSTSCPATTVRIDKTPPNSPNFTGFEYSRGTVTSNNCWGKGGTASDASCSIYITSNRGIALTVGHSFGNSDSHSGFSYEQYQWNHNGPGTKCNYWFNNNCGNWLAGESGQFSYTTFSARSVDKVGNAGYSLAITVYYTWF